MCEICDYAAFDLRVRRSAADRERLEADNAIRCAERRRVFAAMREHWPEWGYENWPIDRTSVWLKCGWAAEEALADVHPTIEAAMDAHLAHIAELLDGGTP